MHRTHWSIPLLLLPMVTGCATMHAKLRSPGPDGPNVSFSCPISDQVFQRNTTRTGDIPIRAMLNGKATGPLEVRFVAIDGLHARSTGWRKFPVVDGKIDGIFS